MNTSKNIATSFNLDDLIKRVENIVDEQIHELGQGKSRSSQNQLMKEDFARGNPYSPNARQADDKSQAVFSKLRSEEDQKVVSNLADRLKESICRAIDEYSEGLYNQLQAKPAPCRCEEKGCHHPAGEKAGEDGINAASEKVPEASSPQVEDVTETLISPPALEEAPTEEVITAEASPPQIEDVTETLISPPTLEEAPTEEVITAEASPPQIEDVTEPLISPPTLEEAPTEEVITAEASLVEDITEPLISPPTLEEAPTEEVITAEASPPQVEDVTETLISPPTLEEAPTEEVITAEASLGEDITETPVSPPTLEEAPTEEVIAAEPAPAPEEVPQQGGLFNSSFSFGQSAVEQPVTPEANNNSGDAPHPTPPALETSPPAVNKASSVVSKTAADMQDINKQRLDQYFAKKIKFSV